MHSIRLAAIVLLVATAGCAHAISPGSVTARVPARDALVVLPGFGYGRGGEQAFKALEPSLAAEGIDLYVPKYVSRKGLYESRASLTRFFRDARLERYERVHVFAFIAGGWTLNRILADQPIPNLTTVVYDRSPYQERAPRIAQDRLPILTWFRYGSAVADVARTNYVPLTDRSVRVGLVVETRPTGFVSRYARAADRLGPYRFGCDSFAQHHDDCIYVALNHTELYSRFADVWPDLRSFVLSHQFTASADRVGPSGSMQLAIRK